MNYWSWLLRGSGDRPGYRTVVNAWLVLHLTIGVGLVIASGVSLADAADTVLLPLFGVFVGISFAWAGNAQALLQSPEMDVISRYAPGGFTDYVFTFQTATLVFLTAIVAWGLAGLEVFGADRVHLISGAGVVGVALYALLSLSVRECWLVVLATQSMLLAWKDATGALKETGERQGHASTQSPTQ